MELKYLVILSVLGAVAGFTVPQPELDSSFPASSSDSDTPSTREKRGLLFKKLKKHQSTVYVDRRHEGTVGYDYRPSREVHHHHHYSSYPNAPVQQPQYQPYPAPSQEYHHYHGGAPGYQQQGSYASAGSYNNGGGAAYAEAGSAGSNYYPRPNYGDGGYAHYGAAGAYNSAPQPQHISAAPLASGHNSVDRGQGAAAVNNIAIIHARAGSSNNLVESESKTLPRPLPVNIEDLFD